MPERKGADLERLMREAEELKDKAAKLAEGIEVFLKDADPAGTVRRKRPRGRAAKIAQ